MSNAARKARKQAQRAAGDRYQHPTREGIPYGNSKQPNLSASLPSAKTIEQTALMVAAAREGALWY